MDTSIFPSPLAGEGRVRGESYSTLSVHNAQAKACGYHLTGDLVKVSLTGFE